MRHCPRCGDENNVDARFCSSCGTALAQEQSRGAVRKTVSIVFSDIVGFTKLAEEADPERLRLVMGRYAEEMRRVIEGHGGTVEKFIGDAVMAVFGAPRLHEDDALRAVRAAAEMSEALQQLNPVLARERGVTLQVRTGVNTGEVVVGAGTPGGALVVGDPVNVAARLQQSAAPGDVLLGEDTYRLVKGAVSVEPLDPITVKGRHRPVSPFRLLAVLPGVPTTRQRRFDSPIVGRERELAVLDRALRETVAENRCRRISVYGPPGIGKSRLVAEFLARVPDEATVLQAHCLPYGEGITFWPVAEIVKQAAFISGDEGSDQARTKIEAVLEEEGDDAFIADRLAHVLGLPAAAASQEEIFWAVRKLLESLAHRGPLVVIFEDVHWAESAFLDLVDHISTWSRDAPILMVCLARPEVLEKHPTWQDDKASAVMLGPLSDDDSRKLVANLLGTTRLTDSARARVGESAGGNPLYLEEMVTMLVDERLLRRDGPEWRLTADLGANRIPVTLQGLLAARLERLGPEQQRVVDVASVIGNAFSRLAVYELLGAEDEERVTAALTALADAELFDPDPSVVSGGFRFHHALYRDAAYTGLAKEVRAELHETYAGWLERTSGDSVGEFEEVVGFHLERAYRYRTQVRQPDDRAAMLALRAAERLAPAGCRAFTRGDMVAAANLLGRAVSLFPGGHRRALALLPDLAEALMNTGELERAGAILETAAASGDERLRAHATLGLATLTFFTDPGAGGAERLRREATSTIPVFEEVDDHLGLARAWKLLSIVHLTWARFAEAEETMARAATHARRAEERRDELEALSWLPLMVWAGPLRPEEGLRRCDEILRMAEGDRKVEATVLFVKGGFEAMRGEFDGARRLLDAAQASLEDLGLRIWMAGAFAQMAGWVEQLAGDAAAAGHRLRTGYETLEELGEAGWLPTVAGHLAHALYHLGDHVGAERFSQASEERANPDDVYSQVLWREVRAKVLSGRGEYGEAQRLAREAVVLAEKTDFLQLRGDASATLSDVLHLNDPGQAVSAAAQAIRLYEQKGNLVSAEQARRRLDHLAISP